MHLDDELVFGAELESLRHLANLDRSLVPIRGEDLPASFVLWNTGMEIGTNRDEIRLSPGSDALVQDVIVAAKNSNLRQRGGHLQIRGVAKSFSQEGLSVLRSLGARRDLEGPHVMMALDLTTFTETATRTLETWDVFVATDAEGLAERTRLAGQAFAGSTEGEALRVNPETDFYHAPGTMTYLGVSLNGRMVSTGSFIITNKVASIWTVATLPADRGKGAASAIMSAICTEALRQGATVAALRTTNDLGRRSSLYRGLGFQVVGDEHAWNLDDLDSLTI